MRRQAVSITRTQNPLADEFLALGALQKGLVKFILMFRMSSEQARTIRMVRN